VKGNIMRFTILATVLSLTLLVSVAGFAAMSTKQAPADEEMPHVATIGKAAPDFTLTDAMGEKHTLSDFKGKYVVLEWVNFGCPFVRAQYGSKNMQTLQSEYRDKGVVWLSICSSAPGKQGFFKGKNLQENISKFGSKATAYLIDSDGTVGKVYGAKTTPDMYVISPEGVLLYAGAIDDTPTTDVSVPPKSTNYVSLALDTAMAGKEIKTKATQSYGCGVKY
jgi:peroxiredoxin